MRAMTEGKQARCVVHFCNPSTWVVKASSRANLGYMRPYLNRTKQKGGEQPADWCWRKGKETSTCGTEKET